MTRTLAISLILIAASAIGQPFRAPPVVANIADLVNRRPSAAEPIAQVLEYYDGSGVGGGLWQFIPDDSQATNRAVLASSASGVS